MVTIPMFGFYPDDARRRDPGVGLDQLRLSFSFNEGVGQERRHKMQRAVQAFGEAIKRECGL